MNTLPIIIIAVIIIVVLAFSFKRFTKPSPKPEKYWEDEVDKMINNEIEASLANMTEEDVEAAILGELA